MTSGSSVLAALGALLGFLGLDQQPLQPISWEVERLVPNWESAWVQQLNAPDPVVEALVAQYVDALGADGWPVAQQGVWVQVGRSLMAEHQGQVPLSAASLTKIATTLAALEVWGTEHQFETRIGTTGTVDDSGVLQGDLVIAGGGDPLFVWEEAIMLANQLQALGILQVNGNLVVQGNFSMNFAEDAAASGAMLRQALHRDLWPPEAWNQFATLPPETPQPTLGVAGSVRLQTEGPVNWRVQHRSLPLVALLKAMNIYSNNVMAERLAQLVGGAGAVNERARQVAELSAAEIQLVNGSGLGEENRISPRAAVAMLTTLQQTLVRQGYDVGDVMPVAGEDIGTLIYRDLPLQSAVKTGTLAEVSALAGVVPTESKGAVWFAVINRGWALEELRAQQDQLLRSIQAHWGVPEAESRSQVRLGEGRYRLGDPRRNQLLQ